MRYHYEPPLLIGNAVEPYRAKHPLYSKCTLFEKDGIGFAVVQLRFNEKTKLFWWSEIDSWLIDSIQKADGFKRYFEKNAERPDKDGLYPTVNVRKVMWALRMKPLEKQWWEKFAF